LLPAMISGLEDRKVRAHAAAALSSFGATALPALRAAFADAACGPDKQANLVKIAVHMEGVDATDWLLSLLASAAPAVAETALAGLVARRWNASGAEVEQTIVALEREVARAASINASLIDVGSAQPVAMALSDSLARSRGRCFLWLALLYPAGPVLEARRTLASGQAKQRANALEALDNLMSARIKASIMPLLEDLDPGERCRRFEAHHRVPLLGMQRRLEHLASATGRTPWIRACALYTMGLNPDPAYAAALESLIGDDDGMVREVAQWAKPRIFAMDDKHAAH
jgi:hypothetical protein